MTLPLIGLPGRRKLGSQVDGFGGSLEGVEIDIYLADYSRAVIEAGGLPVNIPMDADVAEVVKHLDGVLLTGGADVDPARYGAEPSPDLGAVEGDRDELETTLYQAAIDKGIPVLGICRGLQLINVVHGGTLEQHVPVHSRYDTPNHQPIHSVDVADGSKAHELYGDRIDVNTLHHQTVAEVGEGLVVSGRSDDGEVEIVEAGENVLAVQWHPEMMKTRSSDPCFAWLVDRARKCA